MTYINPGSALASLRKTESKKCAVCAIMFTGLIKKSICNKCLNKARVAKFRNKTIKTIGAKKMKKIYFPNTSTFGPFLDGRSYSEGVALVALTHEDETAMDDIANGASSSLVGHLARKPASCLNGKITIFGE